MGTTFSKGSLFTAPPLLEKEPSSHRGAGAVRRSRNPEPSGRERSAFAAPATRKQPAQSPPVGNLYSCSINFRPGISAPVDSPQVAVMRARVQAERAGKGDAQTGL